MPTFICVLRATYGRAILKDEKVVPVWGDTDSEVTGAVTDTTYELFPRSSGYRNHTAEMFELSSEVLSKMHGASRPNRDIWIDNRNGLREIRRDEVEPEEKGEGERA